MLPQLFGECLGLSSRVFGSLELDDVVWWRRLKWNTGDEHRAENCVSWVLYPQGSDVVSFTLPYKGQRKNNAPSNWRQTTFFLRLAGGGKHTDLHREYHRISDFFKVTCTIIIWKNLRAQVGVNPPEPPRTLVYSGSGLHFVRKECTSVNSLLLSHTDGLRTDKGGCSGCMYNQMPIKSRERFFDPWCARTWTMMSNVESATTSKMNSHFPAG